jgi:hypothetical protein
MGPKELFLPEENDGVTGKYFGSRLSIVAGMDQRRLPWFGVLLSFIGIDK